MISIHAWGLHPDHLAHVPPKIATTETKQSAEDICLALASYFRGQHFGWIDPEGERSDLVVYALALSPCPEVPEKRNRKRTIQEEIESRRAAEFLPGTNAEVKR